MSSADCFNLDQSKILSSGNGLTIRVVSMVVIAVGRRSHNVTHLPHNPDF